MRLHPLSAERIHALEWEGEDKSLAEIAAQLSQMSAELAHREAGDDAHPHPRNCVMNLIALVHEGEVAMHIGRIMADLSAHHPSRSIVLYQHSPDRPQRIDASVRTHAHALVDGAPIQHEQVILHVQGRALEHVRSLVEPLLIPDVRTHMWWTGTPPLADPTMLQVLQLCDTLVVDSAVFEQPHTSLIALAQLAKTQGDLLGVADFQWARIQPWRELIAQFFDPPERRVYLARIQDIELGYAGEASVSRVASGLLAGWLASRLGWKVQSSNEEQEGVLVVAEAPSGEPVRVRFRSQPSPASAAGEVTGVRIRALADGQTCTVDIEPDGNANDAAQMRMQIGDAQALSQRLPMVRQDDGELLVRMLVQDRVDPVYMEALLAAASIFQVAG
jgi:glucose-6-phosphate dehydrogenase assembly protein OpcA